MQGGGKRLVDRLGFHPEIAAGDVAGGLQLGHHFRYHVGRDGEADADAAAAWRQDGGVDADHLAGLVEQRPAGVAVVDRCVDLNEIVVRPGADIAPTGRHDAGSNGAAKPERIAHREHPFAGANIGGRGQCQVRQGGGRTDLQHRDIAAWIAPDHLGRQFPPVIQGHGHRFGVLHDMVIGHHHAVGTDDEARTAGFGDAAGRTIVGAAMHARRQRHAHIRTIVGRRAGDHFGGDGNHRRLDLGNQVGKVWQGRV